MLYRIYTERKNLRTIKQIVSEYFLGFTTLSGTGYWEGIPEPCLVIEIVGAPGDYSNVLKVADAIKIANSQESVLLTWEHIHREFV